MSKSALGVVIFSLMISLNSWALGWSQQCRDMQESYYHPIDDGAISSVWGNIVTVFDSKFRSNNHLVMRKRTLKSSAFKSGKFELLEAWPKNASEKKRPFIVFNPGVFTKLKGDHIKEFVKRFTLLGYHVIAFANPLDRDFIKFHPNFEVGNINRQAQVIYESARALIQEYKKLGLVEGKIRWVGMSYGAFLTTIIANLDKNHSRPLGSKDITLFSPPFKLTQSISMLDELIIDSRDMGYKPTNIRFLRGAWDILWLESFDRRISIIDPLTIEAKGILGNLVFKTGMAQALTEWDKLTGEVEVPKRRKARREWKDKLLFSDMFYRYSPKYSKYLVNSEDNYLATWVKRLRGSGIAVRILSAEDDFINKGIPRSSFRKDELIPIPTGGHFGYRSLDWFDELVEKAF